MGNKKYVKLYGAFLLLSIIAQVLTLQTFAQTDLIPKNVLIIHAQDQFLPANIVMDRNFYSVLKSSKTLNTSIYCEYLEKVRFGSKAAQKEMERLLREKYDGIKLDLLIITDDLSWDFIKENKSGLFAGIPLIFCGITDGKFDASSLSGNVTENFKLVDIKANIDTILKVQPATKEIAVVLGTSNQDALYEAMTRKAFDEYKSKVKVEYLIGLSIEETEKRISTLPQGVVVLYVSMYTDGAGRGFNPRDVVPLLKKASNVPIYGLSDTYMGYGILGGNLLSFNDLSQDAAQMALQVLNGKKPSEMPTVNLKNRNYFDWGELKRWGIDESKLPAGSVVMFRNPSVWDLYKWQILGFLIFLVLETLLVIFLINQLRLKEKAESELKVFNETLEQRVMERTAQLETINKELESFSYFVSHDLRAPLRHISGFIELLVEHISETLDEKSHHYIDVISGAAVEMGHLIDNLLSFSRMGRLEMESGKVDLNKLVRSVLNTFGSEMEGRSIVWHIEELSDVSGDEEMLKQVFTNLISNALKFTRFKLQAIIELGSQHDLENMNQIVIFIKENGAGFEMQYKAKLFGIFQRLHGQKDFEGTGVGLAIVQRIIQRHGGRVWAEGVGATFYITLNKWAAE